MPTSDGSFAQHYFQHAEAISTGVYGDKADLARLRTIFDGKYEIIDVAKACQRILALNNITPIERQLASRLLALPTTKARPDSEISPFVADKYDENTMDHLSFWSYEHGPATSVNTMQDTTANTLMLYIEEQLLGQHFHDFNWIKQPTFSSDVIGVILTRMDMGAYVNADSPQGPSESRNDWLNRMTKDYKNAQEYIAKVAQVVNTWLTDNHISQSTHNITARKMSPIGGVSQLELRATRR